MLILEYTARMNSDSLFRNQQLGLMEELNAMGPKLSLEDLAARADNVTTEILKLPPEDPDRLMFICAALHEVTNESACDITGWMAIANIARVCCAAPDVGIPIWNVFVVPKKDALALRMATARALGNACSMS